MGFLRRILSRTAAPAQTRRFDGAAGGRRAFGMGHFGRINPEVAAAGPVLRSRARHLVANNPLIANGAANLATGLIGAGINAAPRHPDAETRRAVMAIWDRWTEHADADQRTDFYGLQAAIARGLIVDGEAFAHVTTTDSGPALRLLPPEMIDEARTAELGSVDV